MLKFTIALHIQDKVWDTEEPGYASLTSLPGSGCRLMRSAFSHHTFAATRCWLAGWYPGESEVPPLVLAKPAKQTMLLHRSGLVSQQSPRKHSEAESAFANPIAFQWSTGNGLQQDKPSWWSCQCVMMSHIFSLKHCFQQPLMCLKLTV